MEYTVKLMEACHNLDGNIWEAEELKKSIPTLAGLTVYENYDPNEVIGHVTSAFWNEPEQAIYANITIKERHGIKKGDSIQYHVSVSNFTYKDEKVYDLTHFVETHPEERVDVVNHDIKHLGVVVNRAFVKRGKRG